ncbi:HoxE-like protein [Candidatus Syntrophocurvum alkaliphilum]|uniref:HoxE-like protein n=1 Tax=Candidatus Syntrophocurvum alkaliphilum TaxID=2293317 RepID=A0A6I6DHM3_9FIRM|nr:NAD(P)H-dependent oxidoreductase subunit E [Candidatus Syntrophocurvum alkaliphilum]QGT99099.1 HoxE-like protein [Candidatus Syntrophocurvum alkaliphilum]
MSNYKDIIASNKDKKGGIIEAFHAIQRDYNYIPEEALKEAAKVFGVSEAKAYGVATFYSYLSVAERGKYIIRMCESAPCHIAGADEVLKAFENILGIKAGETTADGRFTLELAECVGQCQGTPVVTINSKPILNVQPNDIPNILENYK